MGKKEMPMIKAYCKEHIRVVALDGAMIAFLLGIAKLYRYEGAYANMLYAVFLLAVFGFLYGLWDYTHYRKKCIMLMEAVHKSGERYCYLADSNSYVDELYRDLISVMEREGSALVSKYDGKKQDMTDYYTMWTHQIKTPIAALRLLLQGEKQPLEELFKIEQYAEMALHFARLDSLSSDLLFQEQDIYAMVKKAVKKYSILFIGSGLSFSMDEFCAQAITDEKWMSFVIEQILSNALKYTYTGGIRIYGTDRLGQETRENASFIVIEDSGIGIRQEDLPRIFERGFTGYNGRLDQKSTGIGLYLCKQILDRLSHTIQVESRIGEGTKVILGFARDDTEEVPYGHFDKFDRM